MLKAAGAARKRVTVVDDDPVSLDVLQRAAALWQFDCQTARSAEEALELLERHPTPVVVTDLRMPGRGGAWLVQEVQKRWPESAVIVVTAGDEDNAMLECLQAGAHHYFLKPIHLDEFHHALQATINGFQLRRERERYRRCLEAKLARKTKRLRNTFFAAINSLVRTLEARDSYTSGHSLRVAEYSTRLARQLDLAPAFLRQLRLSARLHDIGKVGMAEGILNKPDVLTPQEFDIVREHPVIGERILKPIIRGKNILAGIRHHHERFDGAGYPDRLAGESIPFIARIIAVADCYDALTSSRAYRPMLEPAGALELIESEAGRQFDPTLVPVFLDVMRRG